MSNWSKKKWLWIAGVVIGLCVIGIFVPKSARPRKGSTEKPTAAELLDGATLASDAIAAIGTGDNGSRWAGRQVAIRGRYNGKSNLKQGGTAVHIDDEGRRKIGIVVGANDTENVAKLEKGKHYEFTLTLAGVAAERDNDSSIVVGFVGNGLAAREYKPSIKVTKAMYDEIEPGMTYEQVVNILGFDGEERTTSELSGIRTTIYVWQNRSGSNMHLTFQNGQLTLKAQYGLK